MSFFEPDINIFLDYKFDIPASTIIRHWTSLRKKFNAEMVLVANADYVGHSSHNLGFCNTIMAYIGGLRISNHLELIPIRQFYFDIL